ncbi:MAG: hypothetical protein HF312_15335 [Ignavibacteria bacterium]|jgi:hypothetical protein|nr:hypothetical protein [Ignavibacteria bacterium]
MKAIFATRMFPGGPDLPRCEAQDVPQLVYTDADGVRRGGFTCLEMLDGGRVRVEVTASETTIQVMQTDGRYEYVETVPEETPNI